MGEERRVSQADLRGNKYYRMSESTPKPHHSRLNQLLKIQKLWHTIMKNLEYSFGMRMKTKYWLMRKTCKTCLRNKSAKFSFN